MDKIQKARRELELLGATDDLSKGAKALQTFGKGAKAVGKVAGPLGAVVTGYVAFKNSSATTETGREVDGVLTGASSLIPAVGINQAIGGAVDLGFSAAGVENAGVGNVIGGGNVITMGRAAVTDLGSALFSTDPRSSGRELTALNNSLLSGKQGKFSQKLAQAGSFIGDAFYEYNTYALGKKLFQAIGLVDDPSKPTRGPTMGLSVEHDGGDAFAILFNEKEIGSYDGTTNSFTFTDAFTNSNDPLELARLEKTARGQLTNDWQYEFTPPK